MQEPEITCPACGSADFSTAVVPALEPEPAVRARTCQECGGQWT